MILEKESNNNPKQLNTKEKHHKRRVSFILIIILGSRIKVYLLKKYPQDKLLEKLRIDKYYKDAYINKKYLGNLHGLLIKRDVQLKI